MFGIFARSRNDLGNTCNALGGTCKFSDAQVLETLGGTWKAIGNLRKVLAHPGTLLESLGMRLEPLQITESPRKISMANHVPAMDVLAMWPVTDSGREALRRARGDHKTQAEAHVSNKMRNGIRGSLLLTSAPTATMPPPIQGGRPEAARSPGRGSSGISRRHGPCVVEVGRNAAHTMSCEDDR